MTACATCGKELATSDVLYDERGEIVCAACSETAGLARDERKAGRNIKVAAITSAVAGVFGFLALVTAFGLGFWVGAIAAVSSGIFALNGMAGIGSERFTKTLSHSDKLVTWAGVAIGLGVSAYELLDLAGIVTIRLWIR